MSSLSESSSRRCAALVATWLALVLAGGWLVHHSEVSERDGLDERFTARAQTSARFVAAYADEVFDREQLLADTALRGPIAAADFSALMTASGFAAAVVLDSIGTVLAVQPSDPDLLGAKIGANYAHLRSAMAGVPTVSNVVPAASLGLPVVGFAVPYVGSDGDRVFSGAHLISRSPLQTYLANEMNDIEAAYLVDDVGVVVASSRNDPGATSALADLDPELASHLEPGTRVIGACDMQRQVVTLDVADVPWRLVFSTPTSYLYAPATGFPSWVARLVLLALALAALSVVVLVERTARQRVRLSVERVRSHTATQTGRVAELKMSTMALVAESAGDAMFGRDLDGRVNSWNASAERVFGWTSAQVMGGGVNHPFVSGHEDEVTALMELVVATHAVHKVETSRLASTGHVVDVALTVAPLMDSMGDLVGVSVIARDVGERRRLEEERRRAAIEVARARDEALAATAAKSAFLSTMSHEIRTPMNAVIGLTGLLLDTDLDDQQRDFVETVRSSGDALLVLINDILDFSKIEAGELTVEQRTFDLAEMVDGSLDLVGLAAAGKGIDLLCYLAPNCLREVVGDQTRLRQVLVNLMSNAVKFTAVGHVLVTVAAEPAVRGQQRLVLAVSDTGIGIASDRMGRLFRSFSQVDDSTTRV